MFSTVLRSLRSSAARHAVSARSAAAPVARRYASSSHGGAHSSSSDLPWIIGSALVFVPLGGYVVNDLRNFKAGGGHGHDDHGHGGHAEKHAEKHEDEHEVKEVEGADESEEKSIEQAVAATPASSDEPLEKPSSSASGPEGDVPSPDADKAGNSAQPTGSDAPAAKSPSSNSSAERHAEAEAKDAGGNDPQSGSDNTTKEGARDKIAIATESKNQKDFKEKIQADEKPREPKDETKDE